MVTRGKNSYPHQKFTKPPKCLQNNFDLHVKKVVISNFKLLGLHNTPTNKNFNLIISYDQLN